MSLLDDLARGVKSVAESASTEVTRYTLRNQLREEEQAIWQIYAQMGYRALELLNAGAIEDGKLRELSLQMAPHLGQIEQLRAQLAEEESKAGGSTQPAAPSPTTSADPDPSATPTQPPPTPSSGVVDLD